MSKFIDLIKSKVGCGYVLGSQGEVITPARLQALSKLNTPDMNKIAQKWIGKVCFDCSGLIVFTLIQLGFLKPGEDYTADGLFYKECKPITKEQLLPNDLVFIKVPGKGIIHVGVYIGNDQVIEAKGTPYGVVQSTLSKTDFNTFGRLKFDLDPMDLNKAIGYLQSVGLINAPDDMKDEFKNKKLTPSRFESLIIKCAEKIMKG